MRFIRVFLLLILCGSTGIAAAQHLQIRDSLTGKVYKVPFGFRIKVKSTQMLYSLSGRLHDIDDSGLCISARKKEWINFNDLEYIAYKPDQMLATVTGLIISGVALGISMAVINSPPVEGSGGAERNMAMLTLPFTALLIPVSVTQLMKAAMPTRTFFIGKDASVRSVRKKKRGRS